MTDAAVPFDTKKQEQQPPEPGSWPQREHLHNDVKAAPMPFHSLSRRGLAGCVALFSSEAELSTQRCSPQSCVPLSEYQDTR